MRRSTCGFLLLSLSLVTQTPSAHAEAVATFQGLGDLTGGGFDSIAYGVSDDGSTVVGSGTSASGTEAFRWTAAGGMTGLGDLTGGGFNSRAVGVSADGTVAVGRGSSASGLEAFRWTASGGMVGLGDLPGNFFQSWAEAVSGNGSVVVGEGASTSGSEAFRWTASGGMVGLGDLPGGSFSSRAIGASSDGSVIVGRGTSASGSEAFRWTASGGMVGLGDLPGGSFQSWGLGVSSDGSTVVGNSISAFGYEAYRWTASSGMVGLGDLAGGIFQSTATAVSSDGSAVVGYSNSATSLEAFFWTNDTGMRSVASILSTFGVSSIGFTSIISATDITVFGNSVTIVGQGDSGAGYRQAYRAQIPVVSASLADELLSLTPGLTSDTLALDVSATKLLYGNVGRYEFDFTTDGIYDLVLDVGTPLFDSHWDALSESFLFSETELRTYYPTINTGSFGSLSFNTRIRMTHENGTAINTSDAVITVVPEVGSLGLLVTACFFGTGIMAIRRRSK